MIIMTHDTMKNIVIAFDKILGIFKVQLSTDKPCLVDMYLFRVYFTLL